MWPALNRCVNRVCLPMPVQGALMNPKIQEFLDRIQQLEAAIEQEAKSRRQQWQADFEVQMRRPRFYPRMSNSQK